MNAKEKLHQVHLQEWAARFTDQKNSGLPVKQWCEQNNLSYHAYNYWKHLLKETVVDNLLPDIVPLQLPESVCAQLSTTQNDTSNHANRTICASHTEAAPVKLTINGITVETDTSISEAFLTTLIKAVRYA